MSTAPPGQAGDAPHALREQLAAGVGWTAGAHLAKQAVTLVLQVALARLLAPEQFGLLGMVVVFSGFAALCVDLGFGPALVHAARVDRRLASSVYWLTAAAGLALGALTLAAGPSVAAFYDEPALRALTPLVAAQIALSAFSVVPAALLARELRFRALAAVEVTASLAAGGLAVGLALRGHGAAALGAQLACGAGAGAIGLHLAARFRPALRVDLAAVRELVRYGGFLVGHRVFEYWVRNADKMIIGRALGSEALGLYHRAYSTMLLPVSQIGDVAGRVLFPALSRLRFDPARSRALYLRALRGIAVLSFPLMTGIFAVAEEFLIVVFGAPWAGAAPVLRVLCLVGLMQSIGTTAGWIWRAHGRTDEQFRFGVVAGISALLAFAVGIRFGVLGVAVAYLVRNLALTWFNFALPGRLIGLRYRDVVAAVAGIAACAGAMGAAVMALGALAGPPSPASLAAKTLAGAVLYAALVVGLRLKVVGELRTLLEAARRVGSRPSAPPLPVPTPSGSA